MMSSDTSIFIVSGMHRSGTSLVAAVLQQAGIFMGQRRARIDPSNPIGNFEDLDFVDLHESILSLHGESKHGWTLRPIFEFNQHDVGRARSLIEERTRSHANWGWKDPRTVLFLDFWLKQLPAAHFVFVYRPPWEVMDSLYRRGDAVFQSAPDLAAKSWTHYNQLILQFHESHASRCVLLSLNAIVHDPHCIIENVNRKFHTSLVYTAGVLDESLLNRNSEAHRRAIVHHYFPDAIRVYGELNRCAEQPDPHGWDDYSLTAPPSRLALQDWSAIRIAEWKLNQKAAYIQELEKTRIRGESADPESEQTKSSPYWKNWAQWASLEKHLRHLRKFLCAIESPRNGSVVDVNFQMSGWCFSPRSVGVKNLRARIGNRLFNGVYGLGRKDVARFYPESPEAENSGFRIPLRLEPGRIKVLLEALDAGGKWKRICTCSFTVVEYEDDFDSANEASPSDPLAPHYFSFLKRWSHQLWHLPARMLRFVYLLCKHALERHKRLGFASLLDIKGIAFQVRHLFHEQYRRRLGFNPPKGFEIPTQVDPYTAWLSLNEWNDRSAAHLRSRLDFCGDQLPQISVLMPVFNPPLAFLEAAVTSVMHQIHTDWELCIVDDASTDPLIQATLRQWAAKDERIQLVLGRERSGISLATNNAATLAAGEFLLFLDHDDELSPDALAEIAIHLTRHPEVDFLYTDDDKIDGEGNRYSPQFKPDWSPELLLSYCYVSHACVVRKSLFEQLGLIQAKAAASKGE